MQSALVLPMIVPPVVEAAGDATAVAALDGGFLEAFRATTKGAEDVAKADDPGSSALAALAPWVLPPAPLPPVEAAGGEGNAGGGGAASRMTPTLAAGAGLLDAVAVPGVPSQEKAASPLPDAFVGFLPPAASPEPDRSATILVPHAERPDTIPQHDRTPVTTGDSSPKSGPVVVERRLKLEDAPVAPDLPAASVEAAEALILPSREVAAISAGPVKLLPTESPDGNPSPGRPGVPEASVPSQTSEPNVPMPARQAVAPELVPSSVPPLAKAMPASVILPEAAPPEPEADLPPKTAGEKAVPQTDLRKPLSAPGFWERLLSSIAVPMDQVTSRVAEARTGSSDALPVELPESWSPPTVAVPRQPELAARAQDGPPDLGAAPAQTPPPHVDADDEPPDGAALALVTLGGPGPTLPSVPAAGAQAFPAPHIAAQITAALSHSPDGATELALSPEELGHVRLRLERDAKHPDRMVVMITFERPETLDLFRRHAGELAEALRSAGFAGADIGFGQQGSGAQGSGRAPEGASPYGDHRQRVTDLPDTRAPEPQAPRLMAGASLDLRL